jgi:hypothetical protein
MNCEKKLLAIETRRERVTARKSKPLTKAELQDIHRSIREIETGKTRCFKNVEEALKWLHRKRRTAE